MTRAYEFYARGERGKTVAERSAAFNEALALYAPLAERSQEPRLLFNVANCYFQLDEPAWAIVYYERARKEAPREDKIRRNLEQALARVGLAPEPGSQVLQDLLFFHTLLAEREKLTLFTLFFALSFGLFSLYIWWPKRPLFSLGRLVLALSLLFLGSVLYTQFLAPVEGILIRASALHRDAGDHYASVTPHPLAPGQKVEVKEVVGDGRWFQVETQQGEKGYVSKEALRII